MDTSFLRHRMVLVLAVAVVAGGGIVGALAATGEVPSEEEPTCPPVSEGGYQMVLAPSAGRPGTSVTAAGPVPLHGESGEYQPPDESSEIEFWWNVSDQDWESLLPGGTEPTPAREGESVALLGKEELSDLDQCRFEFSFEVPAAAPATYPIVAVIYGGGGATLFDDSSFQVLEE